MWRQHRLANRSTCSRTRRGRHGYGCGNRRATPSGLDSTDEREALIITGHHVVYPVAFIRPALRKTCNLHPRLFAPCPGCSALTPPQEPYQPTATPWHASSCYTCIYDLCWLCNPPPPMLLFYDANHENYSGSSATVPPTRPRRSIYFTCLHAVLSSPSYAALHKCQDPVIHLLCVLSLSATTLTATAA